MRGRHDVGEEKIGKGGDWQMNDVGMYIWLLLGLR